MKKIISIISLSFLVLLLLVGCEKSSSDWMKYRDDNDGNVYSYKKVNINKDDGNHIVQVWVKKVYSDTDRKIKIPPPHGQFIDDFDSMDLNEIDCKKRKIRILSTITYYTDGKKSSKNYDDSKWNYIVPDSNDENLLKIVCK